MRALSRDTLTGLWAAIPTPWNCNGQLDEGILRRNCERYATIGVDGVYTTDSDGEFYAIEVEEFRQLARVIAQEFEGTRIDVAMGVTWCNTRGIIDRIRIVQEVGIYNVHVAFPFWMPLARPDMPRFFEDLARAVPEARWIHYAHPQAGPPLSGTDYARLAQLFPEQLIGTKLGTSSIQELTEILLHAPALAHFVVDTTLTVGMLLGARGCYSYWVNTLPRWHRGWIDACLVGDWDDARRRHRKLIAWEIDYIKKLRDAGHWHGIISKARVALSGFLEDSGHTRPPYYPIAEDLQAELRNCFRAYWAEELATEVS